MAIDRRGFIKFSGLSIAGAWVHVQTAPYLLAQTQSAGNSSLAHQVEAVCRRLAPLGWRDLLRTVTGGEFDLGASDLARLTKPLRAIRRDVPGFEDFASEGRRGIEPGHPAQSLLYHALASPCVLESAAGRPLAGFPTLAEIGAVENYVYGVKAPSLESLRSRAAGAPLAIVVFAPEYRTVSHTIHRKHADLCFARCAFARVGTVEARYDPARREYLPFDERDPHAFRALPARFAPYLAMQVPGRQDSFGPMRGTKEDAKRAFWVPLHKLFSGRECLEGMDLEIDLTAHFMNEKLRRFHGMMAARGFATGWNAPETDNFPFVMRDDVIARFSDRVEEGPGLVMPVLHPLFEKAVYQGKPLGYDVPKDYSTKTGNTWFSSLQILPVEGGPDLTSVEGSLFGDGIAYMDGINAEVGRHAPEYLNSRHRLLPDGGEENLNDSPDVLARVIAGGYRAQHYIDYTADGWVAASCPQLAQAKILSVPAYAGVSPPDFFPGFTQRELMEWWEHKAPRALRRGLWCIQPIPLSDRRMAANITLPAGFTIADDTVTAIVAHPGSGTAGARPHPASERSPFTRLPDGSNGVFDPGWDVSQDTDAHGTLFLANHGLGTPFIEDMKLCAALGSYWPAVAPDSTRTFQPGKEPQGTPWPWPTIVPMTDEEIGSAEVEGGGFRPWDGVGGPQIVMHEDQEMARYADLDHADYIDLPGTMTAALTSRIDLPEYARRVLAMAAVYRALGVREEDYVRRYNTEENALNRLQLAKSRWTVVSFRKLDGSDDELKAAERDTATRLASLRYRFHVYRPGKQIADPQDVRKVLVEMQDQVLLYVDVANVLLKYRGGRWLRERAAPTS